MAKKKRENVINPETIKTKCKDCTCKKGDYCEIMPILAKNVK